MSEFRARAPILHSSLFNELPLTELQGRGGGQGRARRRWGVVVEV